MTTTADIDIEPTTASTAAAAAPAPVDAPPQNPAPEADPDDLIERMVDYVVTIAPALAPKRKHITADMRKEFGGQRWYVHSRQPTERQKRITDILSHFNGRNASEVARKLKVSRATVYRVIKQPGKAGK